MSAVVFLVILAVMLAETAIAFVGYTYSDILWIQPLLLVAFVSVPFGLMALVDKIDL